MTNQRLIQAAHAANDAEQPKKQTLFSVSHPDLWQALKNFNMAAIEKKAKQ